MKSIGIVRKVDVLGRVGLPAELRKTLHIELKDSLAFFTEDNTVILRKYHPGCLFCGQANGLKHLKGKNICQECLSELIDI